MTKLISGMVCVLMLGIILFPVVNTQVYAQESSSLACYSGVGDGVGVVIVKNANVRSGPGLSYSVLDQFPRNARARIVELDSKSGWYTVVFANCLQGFIHSSVFAPISAVVKKNPMAKFGGQVSVAFMTVAGDEYAQSRELPASDIQDLSALYGVDIWMGYPANYSAREEWEDELYLYYKFSMPPDFNEYFQISLFSDSYELLGILYFYYSEQTPDSLYLFAFTANGLIPKADANGDWYGPHPFLVTGIVKESVQSLLYPRK